MQLVVRCISQQALADECGVHQTTVSKVVLDKTYR